MPQIEFSRQSITNAKAKIGVYRSLAKEPKLPINKESTAKLKEFVIQLVERAFRRYAKCHKGATSELIDKAWKVMKKELEKEL